MAFPYAYKESISMRHVSDSLFSAVILFSCFCVLYLTGCGADSGPTEGLNNNAPPPSPTIAITVTKQGTGSGTVTSTPAGINCGATCSNQFDAGTSVALNAAAAAGSSFVSWGGACSGNGACTVTGNASVSATFNTIPTNQLTVNKSGTGTGTVTSNPSGISCGTVCASDFPIGSTVALTAASTGGSTFTGWSGGGCSGTGSCTVTMSADQTVTANFTAPPNTFTLTVTPAGAGVGTVTSSPAGINCGATCSSPFVSGTSVTLTATAPTGSTFGGWSGSGCSGTGTCVVAMTQNRAVTATFNAVPSTLTVTKAGGGTGTVTSNPAGINCGNTCSAPFPTGSSVTLTATPSAGSVFAGWSGGGCGGTGTCTTVMATSQTVVATFSVASTLTVNKSGSGNGTVTSNPAGINCGADCNQSYEQGTVVTLTATPNGMSNFTGWSGPCSGTGTCTITLTANTTVGAQFTRR